MNLSFKMNKEVFSIHKLGEEPKPYLYWINQSLEKKLDAIEFLRKQINGSQSRLQKVFRITKLT